MPDSTRSSSRTLPDDSGPAHYVAGTGPAASSTHRQPPRPPREDPHHDHHQTIRRHDHAASRAPSSTGPTRDTLDPARQDRRCGLPRRRHPRLEDEIEREIRATSAGEVTFGAGIAARALARFGTAAAGTPTADRPFPQLTEREAEILELIARGLSNADIARRLFLSEKTIRNNVSAIFGKLDVHDRAQAVARARDARLAMRSGP